MTKEQEESIEYLKKHIKYFEEQIKFIEATDCDYYDEELELYQNRVKQFNTVLSILEEKDKGINSLMQSRKKWKNRYYKIKNKNKDLQKSVEQIYDDYQDIGKMAFDYSDKIEEKDKIIDLYIDNIMIHQQVKTIRKMCCPSCPIGEKACTYSGIHRDCIKQYFENKAKE